MVDLVDFVADLQAQIRTLTAERDAERQRVDTVIAEFDAPWPHSHTVAEVVSGSLVWKIHECRRAFEDRAEKAEAQLAALEPALRTLREAVDVGERTGPHPWRWKFSEQAALLAAAHALLANKGGL